MQHWSSQALTVHTEKINLHETESGRWWGVMGGELGRMWREKLLFSKTTMRKTNDGESVERKRGKVCVGWAWMTEWKRGQRNRGRGILGDGQQWSGWWQWWWVWQETQKRKGLKLEVSRVGEAAQQKWVQLFRTALKTNSSENCVFLVIFSHNGGHM